MPAGTSWPDKPTGSTHAASKKQPAPTASLSGRHALVPQSWCLRAMLVPASSRPRPAMGPALGTATTLLRLLNGIDTGRGVAEQPQAVPYVGSPAGPPEHYAAQEVSGPRPAAAAKCPARWSTSARATHVTARVTSMVRYRCCSPRLSDKNRLYLINESNIRAPRSHGLGCR
jgi:hypothetical protein